MTDRRRRWLLAAATYSVVAIGVISAPELEAQARGRIGAPPIPPVVPRAAAPTVPQPLTARVIGVVFDSVAMKPLADALVQLVSSADPSRVRSAKSDARGAYAIDSVLTGMYLLGFFHARLDSLGIEGPLVQIDVRMDGEIRAPIAIPSSRTLIARLCGPAVASASQGLFMGYVRSSRAEGLSTPARIRAQWSEVTVGPRGVERRNPARYATTTASGAFTICGLPSDVKLTSRAFVGPDSSGFVELELPKGGLLYRDMYVGAATKVAVSPTLESSSRTDGRKGSTSEPISGSRSTVVLRGNGKLRGTVRSATGQPIAGARVTVWGSGVDATTNTAGQFALQELPSGTYTLESRAIGYTPKRSPVDVLDGTEGTTELAMDIFVPMVDTMRVRADRNPARDAMADFDQRKKSGFGYFIDEEALSKRNAMYMSDVFRMTPGMSISPGQLGGDQVLMRGSGGSGTCVPSLFVNGSRVFNDDGVIDNIVNPQDVRAVEVYTRTASLPLQFQTQNGCGSIVIWTGARRGSGGR